MLRPPPISPLFPYTTLFRSVVALLLIEARSVHFLAGELVARDLHLSLRRRRILGVRVFAYDQLAGKEIDRKSTRLNSSHGSISYAVFCLKKIIQTERTTTVQ